MKSASSHSVMNSRPDATVIIPTFNRAKTLLATLNALARVDYRAGAWEALVIDDGSTDDTEYMVPRWVSQTGAPVRYLRWDNGGPAAARNRGADAARGELLIFIDNDIVVEPDFISAHVTALAANPGCWILGRVRHPAELCATPFGRYRNDCHERFHLTHPRAESGELLAETRGLTAQNISMPASDFHRLGGFDESFTIASCEDWDLGVRARQAGIRVLYHPGIVALHNDWADSLERFCERQRLYSVSDVLLWRKYGEDCLRAHLVRENAFVHWSEDAPNLILKKLTKRLLATAPGAQMIRAACAFAEKLAPDSRLNHRAYKLAEAIAIFRGVREGIRRYGAKPAPRGEKQQCAA